MQPAHVCGTCNVTYYYFSSIRHHAVVNPTLPEFLYVTLRFRLLTESFEAFCSGRKTQIRQMSTGLTMFTEDVFSRLFYRESDANSLAHKFLLRCEIVVDSF